MQICKLFKIKNTTIYNTHLSSTVAICTKEVRYY